MHAVKEWGYKPSEFGLCDPEEDLLFMTAHDEAIAEMKNFEDYKAELKRREQDARRKSKGKHHLNG